MKFKFKFTKKRIAIGLIAILITGGSYYWHNKSKDENQATQYKTAKAIRETLSVIVSGSGNIIVDDSANIDPTITGTVTNLSVAVGDYVEKGQFLFSIDNDDLTVTVKKAHTSYLQSLASLETAKASKKDAKEDYEDASSSDKAKYKKRLTAAEIAVEVAEENIESAWITYQNELANYSERNVVASISGTVNAINIKNGDDLSRLSSNSNSEAPIVLGDLNSLKAQIEVSEVDIASIEVGQPAILTFNALSDFEASGKIEKIDALGTSSSGVVTYDITIGFDNLDPKIKSGMSVSASITTRTQENTITVPNNAVKIDNDDRYYVEILKDGIPIRKSIEVGLEGTTKTEILSGISENEIIITQPINSGSTTSSSSSSNRGGMRFPGM